MEPNTPPPPAPSFLSMGPHTYQVSVEDIFGRNRKKLVSQLRETKLPPHSIVYIEGGKSTTRYDSDHEPLFRQESYFLYLLGVKEPDCVACIDIDSGSTTLYIPKLPKDYAIIMGAIKSCEQFQHLYGVETVETFSTDNKEEIRNRLLEKITGHDKDRSSSGKLLLMKGTNTDSGKDYEPPLYRFQENKDDALPDYIDTETLFPILAECRVIKSEYELHLLRYVTEITSFAHVYTMKNMKPSMYEYQGESLFRHYCYYNYGCRLTGYTSICGCGPNASILHYGHTGEPNARQLNDGDICLFDMGAEYSIGGGYGSDITCSFPANGKFTRKQAGIYTAVLNAQKAVYEILRPGISYVTCHKVAEKAILKQLISIGIIVLPPTHHSENINDNENDDHNKDKIVNELVDMRLGAVFMPHGLGHFIGIDTHDVGGYLQGAPARSLEPGLKSLRTSRVLQQNMILTVEPGCYFITHLLDEAMSPESPFCKYLNAPLINKEYKDSFGGVRLEDVVAITETGCINYTLCPRTIAEVESVMSNNGKWPPMVDEAPELHRQRLTDPNPLQNSLKVKIASDPP